MVKITRKYRKAKGFTLVELLIVIIIIGILAGMMMLAAGSATDKAEATKIVSNMRNIKAAAVMAYADNGGWPVVPGSEDLVNKYIDQKDLLTASGDYTIVKGTSDDYKVVFDYSGQANGIQDKLKAMGSPFENNGTKITLPIN